MVTPQATSTEANSLWVTPSVFAWSLLLMNKKPLMSSAWLYCLFLLQTLGTRISKCSMQKEIRMMWGLTEDCHISAAWIALLCHMSGCTCSTDSTCSSLHPHAQGWEFYWHTPQLGTTEMQLCVSMGWEKPWSCKHSSTGRLKRILERLYMFRFLDIQRFVETEEGEKEEVKHKNYSVTLKRSLKGVLSLKAIITELSPLLYKAGNYLNSKT